MTRVFTRAQPDGAAPGPAVHVLAIGVGKYPYLMFGDSEKEAAKTLELEQLTSPPVSVKAVVDFFLGRPYVAGATAFVNDTTPLGSIEALASAKQPVVIETADGDKPLDVATRENIKEAFKGWLARMSEHDHNIGVFYFCGHGIMVANQYLLAQDFGEDDDEPWAKAFDINETIAAVERTVKGTVYYFIDACRQVSTTVALTKGSDPPSLKAVELKLPVVRTSTTLLQATGEGKLAFAEEEKVSRFTDALLTAMSGYSGVKPPGGATWDVDGELLSSATRKLLVAACRGAAEAQVNDQTTKGTSVPLLMLHKAPLVKVGIYLTPEEMRVLAKLFLRRDANDPGRVQEGLATPFSFEIQRGYYDVGATPLVANKFQDRLFEGQELMPPTYDLVISVQP